MPRRARGGSPSTSGFLSRVITHRLAWGAPLSASKVTCPDRRLRGGHPLGRSLQSAECLDAWAGVMDEPRLVGARRKGSPQAAGGNYLCHQHATEHLCHTAPRNPFPCRGGHIHPSRPHLCCHQWHLSSSHVPCWELLPHKVGVSG